MTVLEMFDWLDNYPFDEIANLQWISDLFSSQDVLITSSSPAVLSEEINNFITQNLPTANEGNTNFLCLSVMASEIRVEDNNNQ